MSRRTLAFVGHGPRKLGSFAADSSTARWVRVQLAHAVLRAYRRHFRYFLSSGAPGAARWAIELLRAGSLEINTGRQPATRVELREIRLTVARACPSEVSSEELEGVDAVIDVGDDPCTPEARCRRDEWMIDRADALVAVWNGSGGAVFRSVQYARTHDVPVYRIDPAWRECGWLRHSWAEGTDVRAESRDPR